MGRLFVRYLGNYLPGPAPIVPKNRPGAGALDLATPWRTRRT